MRDLADDDDDDAISNCSNYIEIVDDHEGSNQSFRSPYASVSRSKKDGFAAIEARLKRLEEREHKNDQMLKGVNSKIDSILNKL